MSKNIEINIKNESGYEVLYPNIKANNVIDFSGNNPLLSDSTKEQYELNNQAVVDDVLKLLSRFQNGLGKEWLWDKQKVEQKYELGEKTNYITNYSWGRDDKEYDVSYSDTLNISPDGTATLSNPQTITLTYKEYSAANILAGKFFIGLTLVESTYEDILLYGDPNGTPSQGNRGNMWYGTMFPASPVLNTRIETTHEYINNFDENKYPPTETDGYKYISLGQFGDKVRFIINNYIGTGNYGSSSPNVLEFESEPKLVFITAKAGAYWVFFNTEILNYDYIGYSYLMLSSDNPQNKNNCAKLDRDTNTLYWYSSSGDSLQFNENGIIYYYIALT